MSFSVRLPLVVIALYSSAAAAAAQTPTERGSQLVRDYFAHQVDRISADCLSGVRTLKEWEVKRPEYRRQLVRVLGAGAIEAAFRRAHGEA